MWGKHNSQRYLDGRKDIPYIANFYTFRQRV